MPSPKEVKDVLHVLDLLTTAGPEALPPKKAQPAFQLRRIIGSRNVVAVGVGEKITKKKGTGALALRFYVRRKISLNKLKASDAIPPAVHPDLTRDKDAVRTDVIVLGTLRLDAKKAKTETKNKTKTKAIRPGDSLANIKVTAGTFGALVQSGSTIQVLSNSHVLARGGKAKKGEAILAPSPDDGGKSPADVVARLSRVKKFKTGGSFVNRADCALATPTAARLSDFRSEIPKVGVPRGTIAPKIGMKIVKVGRTTGKTFGVIHDVHFRFAFTYEGVGRVGFRDQVLCTRYSAPGDSGSLVLDRKSKRAVGLHFASAPQGSVFSPIDAVLEALGSPSLVTKSIP